MLACVLSLPTAAASLLPLLPTSPDEMVHRAALSVGRASQDGVLRQVVKVIIPVDPRANQVLGASASMGVNGDPRAGGLMQQFPIAMALGRSILQRVTGSHHSAITDLVLDADDSCGLILAQGATPDQDSACMVFPGCNQIDHLEHVDMMTSRRLLCLVNPQFKYIDDFNMWERGRAQAVIFDRGYEMTYAFEQFACRGEDVKLVCEYGMGWRAFVLLDDKATEGVPLHEGCLPERPDYYWLEAQINQQHPEPRWSRVLRQGSKKRSKDDGKRFLQRGDNEDD